MASKKNTPKTLVLSMNNIRSTVEREGTLPDIIKGLADELALVRDRFGVSEPAAVLLADILEMSGLRSGQLDAP